MRGLMALGAWCVIAAWLLCVAVAELLMAWLQRRTPFVLAGVLLLALAGCGGKQANAPVPVPVSASTPYVRLATYNAIVAEANLALAKTVRTAADVQLITPSTTREIFAWQGQVARTTKTLAVMLGDSAVDIRSPKVVRMVAELAAPPAVEGWLRELSKPEQQLVVTAIRSLANTVALVMAEFGPARTAGMTQYGTALAGHLVLYWTPATPPMVAGDRAFEAADETERILGLEPTMAFCLRDFATAGGAE